MRTFDHPVPEKIMSSKSNGQLASPGTVFSVFCLLLYSAGFIRIELKLNDHDQRLIAVEEVISKLKHEMAETSYKGTIKHKISIFLYLILF